MKKKRKAIGMCAIVCMAGMVLFQFGKEFIAYAESYLQKPEEKETVLTPETLKDMHLEGIDINKVKEENEEIVLKESKTGVKTIEAGDETYYLGLDSNEKKVYSATDIEKMWKTIDKSVQAELTDDSAMDSEPYRARSTTKGHKPVNKGDILVTSDAYKNLIPTGHAAMVLDGNTVVEATAEGVVYGPNDWDEYKTVVYGLLVTSASVNGQAQAAADYCVKRVNRCKYNFNYADVWTRSKFYCSQLVWAAYYDVAGIDLNTDTFGEAIHPMELYWSNETISFYTYNKNGVSGGSYK